jgi:hypothetical protein
MDCFSGMTSSRLHVKTSTVRHTRQNTFVKHARNRTRRNVSTEEIPPSRLKPTIRTSNICKKQFRFRIHYTPEGNQVVRVLGRFPRGTTTGAPLDRSRPR